MTELRPPGWPRPKGYASGVSAAGTSVFVSGQIGWDEHGRFAADDIAGQVGQALRNIVAVLAQAGAGPEHVTRLTWYVTDKHEYLAAQRAIGAAAADWLGAVLDPPVAVTPAPVAVPPAPVVTPAPITTRQS